MNKLRTIFSGKQRYLLILTSFMMLMVTGYRPVNLDVLGGSNVELQQQADEEADTPSEDTTTLSTAYEAIVPVCKIQVAFVYNTLFELELIEEIVESIRIDLPLPQSSYFRILFRTFISPNAP